MSLSQKVHQRPKRVLEEDISKLSLQEQISGYNIRSPTKPGCFGDWGHCHFLARLKSLPQREYVPKIDVSVIPREERALFIGCSRYAGLSNATIREMLEEEEELRINKKIGVIKSAQLSLSEKIKFARPYAIAKMVRELKIPKKQAEEAYDLFQARELMRLEAENEGPVDDFGRPADETYAFAHKATHQYQYLRFFVGAQPMLSSRDAIENVPILAEYARTKAEQAFT